MWHRPLWLWGRMDAKPSPVWQLVLQVSVYASCEAKSFILVDFNVEDFCWSLSMGHWGWINLKRNDSFCRVRVVSQGTVLSLSESSSNIGEWHFLRRRGLGVCKSHFKQLRIVTLYGMIRKSMFFETRIHGICAGWGQVLWGLRRVPPHVVWTWVS